jgi:PAS domain S-box-containing protein
VRRRWLVAALGVAVAITAGSIVLAATSEREDSTSPWFFATAVTAGLAFIVSGVVALWRRPENRTGLLMAAVGFAWFINVLTEAQEPWIFAVGFVFSGLALGAFVQLVLAFPAGRLSCRLDRWLVGLTYLLATVPSALVLLFNSQPIPDCGGCPDSPIVVTDSEQTSAVIQALTAVAALALLAVLLNHVVRRYLAASQPLRRVLAPVLLTSGASLLLLVVALVVQQFSTDAAQPLVFLFIVAFAAVPVAFLLGVLRAKLARSAVGEMLLGLGEGTPLRDALAAALHDPTLEIAYWLPDEERYVDSEGRTIRADGGARVAKLVERDGRPIAALLHDPSLTDEPELVEAVAAGAGLWLENERLQAELRAQFNYMVTLVQTAPSLLVALDTEGRIVNFNIASERAAGYDDPEALRHRFFWDVFIDPEDREQVREWCQSIAPEAPPAEYEHAFTNALGQQVVIAWRAAPLVEDGRVAKIIAGGTDVTERKRQELDTRASEERLRATIEASPAAIVEVELDNRVMAWNPAAKRIFGWTPEEVLGGEVPVIPPELQDESDNLDERLDAGDVITTFETVRRRKDGSLINVAISAAPVRDSSGATVSHVGVYSDITERKREEGARRKSEERLRAAIEASPLAIVELSVDRRVLMWNPAAERIFGWTPDEVIGQPMPTVPEGYDGEYEQLVERVRAGETYTGFETVRQRKDGSFVEVEISAAPIRDAAGEVVSYMGTYADITQRKRQERALRAGESRLRAAFEATPVAIVEISPDQRIEAWNRAAEEIFGWTAEEIVGERLLFVPPEYREEAQQHFGSVRDGQSNTGLESVRMRKDGTRVDVEVSSAPIFDAEGNVVSGMAVFADISERKQREAVLQGERDFLDTLADTIPSMIILVNRDGMIIEDGVNKAFSDALGWTRYHTDRRSFLDLVHPEDDYAVRMAIAAAANGVARTDLEARWLGRDGGSLLVAWSATPISHPIDPNLVLVTGVDITERRRQEEAIRASRARIVEAQDQARRRLERDLHDGAQQRLVALSVSLRLAEAKLAGDADGARELLAASREELGHAIDELRELARGIHPAVLTDRGLPAALEALTSRTPLPVELAVPDGRLPAPVEAAAYYLVAEALTNVARYAAATSARVAVMRVDGALSVEVSDDGVGGADPNGGSGLRGLADRVAALDGTLSVESPPGGGTCVRAEIPVREPALQK